MHCCYEEIIVRNGYAKEVMRSGLGCENFAHILDCLDVPKPLDYLYIYIHLQSALWVLLENGKNPILCNI